MSTKPTLPVVRMELSSGVFRITTGEAIFEISVDPGGGPARVVDQIVQTEAPAAVPPPPAAADVGDTFYKEISQEMLAEIGKLARNLSLSIKEVPPEGVQSIDLHQAGMDLENAKGLLTDVVKMTEKATMEIMDISESIHADCETVQKNLADVKALDICGLARERVTAQGVAIDPAVMQDLLQRMVEIRSALAALPEGAPAAEPPSPDAAAEPVVVQVHQFDVDVLFQTLYELCTNEAVKKHIKAMREAAEAEFDISALQQALSDLAPQVDVEETFYNFPLAALLKMLYQHTSEEKNKQILKKMHQTAASIFLDQVLPVEGTVQEQEVAQPEAAPAQADEPVGQGDMLAEAPAMIDAVIEILQEQVERLGAAAQADDEAGEGFSLVKKEDHDALVAALESSDTVIQNIVANIQRILETLSFQDLSGQRIIKTAEMLTNVQIQLLSILVSFDVKIRKKQENLSLTADETSEYADEEVSRMMSRLSEETWDEEEASARPLDQEAVDKLLGELGF